MGFESVLKKNKKVGRKEATGLLLSTVFMGNAEYFRFLIGSDLQETSGFRFGDLVDLQTDEKKGLARIVRIEPIEGMVMVRGNRLTKSGTVGARSLQVRFNPEDVVRKQLRVEQPTQMNIVSVKKGEVVFNLPS